MKRFLNKHADWLLTLFFGLVVFLFWACRYPFALTFQEQLQLFLFDADYFCERMAEPGGLARYVGEFLVQFYNATVIGALILAILFMMVQRLTWRLMRCEGYYYLSLIPALVLWFAMGDENVMLAYVVALIMAMGCILGLRLLERLSLIGKAIIALVALPLLYWLIGPLALLVAVCMMPMWLAGLGVIYVVALVLASAWLLPYPLMRLAVGIGYYRFPVTIPYLLILIPVLIAMMHYGCRYLGEERGTRKEERGTRRSTFGRLLPKGRKNEALGRRTLATEGTQERGTWRGGAIMALGLAVFLLVAIPVAFDAKKYELMEYDYLVRIKDWNGIIAKAEQQTPDKPMSVSATNLALAMTNQLGERAFEFYQHGSQGLLPPFERNYATSQLTGEIYFFLGLVNTAQRLAFESMEGISNYNKSGRALKRLVETNIINGQYKVAEKYIKILEKTIFYRSWAERMRAMLGDEKAINAHPLYGTLRQYRLQEDFLFSDTELDKICGQLFMHNHQNQMAAQYLLLLPLLDRDMPRFMQYAQYVQSLVRYNPRSCQEAIAFGFMQQRQQPPQGLVSPLILQQLNDFSRIYSAGGKDAPGLQQFRNTIWYYLVK